MDPSRARALVALDNSFYAANAAAFSQTRTAPRDGWRRVLETLPGPAPSSLDVLDVAAGNLRFERFCAAALPGVEMRAVAVDACDELAAPAAEELPWVEYHRWDVLAALLDKGMCGAEALGATPAAFDLAACFGFMHHVPGRKARTSLLKALVDAARPGGTVAVSLWRFLDDERLAGKAREATERARRSPAVADLVGALEPGDALLGWQDEADAFRYCHSFSDDETDDLVRAVEAHADVVARFSADGNSGRLNTYLVLRRHPEETPC